MKTKDGLDEILKTFKQTYQNINLIYNWKIDLSWQDVKMIQNGCGKDIFKFLGYRWYDDLYDFDFSVPILDKWFYDIDDGKVNFGI